ncbi:transposase [Ectothiorhodospiraceae bacterium WFHF3C12]|nr:transposase [Ectothiorhodospiraceae bacterium WFHF3C12]
MPRRARVLLPGVPLHVIQRGNNRQACFFADEDCSRFLEWLAECAEEASCRVHAYVLMTNHVHLLLTPQRWDSAGLLLKRLGQRYVQYVNRTYRRSGTLWEGRFRSCLVADERYVLTCQRYIELNPVRAGMVEHPAEYPWSSYRCSARGESSDVLTPHSAYLELGNTMPERLTAYRSLFEDALGTEVVHEIRSATNGNYALGSERFREEVERTLGRRVAPGRPGRPKKALTS